jgi:hypothetical protein
LSGNKIALAGTIPPGDNDGLGLYVKDFQAHELMPIPVVSVMSVLEWRRRPRTGLVYPVLVIEQWERVPDKYRETHQEILMSAFRDRTGKLELPFPTDQELPLGDPFPEEETGATVHDITSKGANGA